MYFQAPWDKMLKIITYGVGAFLLLETIVMAVVLFLTTSLKVAIPLSALLILGNALLLVLSYLYAPQGFLLDETSITGVRKISPVQIEIGRIQGVSRIEKDRFMKSTRTFGNGGLFGYYGSFRNKELGSFKMYATHGNCGVLIEADRKYVLTPDRPKEFVEVVKSCLPKS
ncbi:MAG: PH domain-containing protein [bacterium]